MDNKIEIGKRIRFRREQVGMTQEQLGEKLGLNKSTIQRMAYLRAFMDNCGT